MMIRLQGHCRNMWQTNRQVDGRKMACSCLVATKIAGKGALFRFNDFNWWHTDHWFWIELFHCIFIFPVYYMLFLSDSISVSHCKYAMPCHAMPCPLPCLALSCLVVSCLVLSCPVNDLCRQTNYLYANHICRVCQGPDWRMPWTEAGLSRLHLSPNIGTLHTLNQKHMVACKLSVSEGVFREL